MRELGGDDSATQDHQGAGQLLHPHDVVVGAVGHARLGDHRRYPGTRAGRQDDLVAGDGGGHPGLAVADLQGALAGESGDVAVEGDVRGLVAAAVLLAALRDRVDALAEDPLLQRLPVHPPAGDGDLRGGRPTDGINAVGADVLELADDIGGVDVHLRRDAADVDAGAAEDALLDDGDLAVVEFLGDGVAGAGADDDQVVVLGGAGLVRIAAHCPDGT